MEDLLGDKVQPLHFFFHPDFYKVAVSSCGCHDNRMDKARMSNGWDIL